jgi:hypothetical protein
MNRRLLAASLALTVLVPMGLSRPAWAGPAQPLQGRFQGFADITAFPTVVVHATGNATQLGLFTFTMPHLVNPATSLAAGTFEFVSARGDRLIGTMTGIATRTEVPTILSIVETATITGGTGKFAGATGGFTIQRLYDRGSGLTGGTFTGSVSTPN